MQPIIAIATTLATVFHLTVGCCVHPGHCDGLGSCSVPNRAICGVEPCGCDHGPDHGAAPTAGIGEKSAWQTGGCEPAAASSSQACDGCRCAATIEVDSAPARLLGDACVGVVPDAASIASIHSVRGTCGTPAPPLWSGQFSPLSERLLV